MTYVDETLAPLLLNFILPHATANTSNSFFLFSTTAPNRHYAGCNFQCSTDNFAIKSEAFTKLPKVDMQSTLKGGLQPSLWRILLMLFSV